MPFRKAHTPVGPRILQKQRDAPHFSFMARAVPDAPVEEEPFPVGDRRMNERRARDLLARQEQQAMPVLREGIALCETKADYVSRELLVSILKSEEEHVDWIETQFELIARMGLQNYVELQSGDAD